MTRAPVNAIMRLGDCAETVSSDNIKSMAMVFGAIRSADRGQPVDIEI